MPPAGDSVSHPPDTVVTFPPSALPEPELGPEPGQPCSLATVRADPPTDPERVGNGNARNIILFRCSKELYFHTFSKIFLSKFKLKNIYSTSVIDIKIFIIRLRYAQNSLPKALHFLRTGHSPPPPPLPYLPCGVSPRLLFHKKIILATFIVSLLVYISKMYLLV